jgi:hypothetical protein
MTQGVPGTPWCAPVPVVGRTLSSTASYSPERRRNTSEIFNVQLAFSSAYLCRFSAQTCRDYRGARPCDLTGSSDEPSAYRSRSRLVVSESCDRRDDNAKPFENLAGVTHRVR